MTTLRPQLTNGLHWVRGELDQSLARARGMIEQHIENPKDTLPLQQAFVELHQIRGTAAMIQCYGITCFSEEMRQTVHELMHDKLKQTEEAYSALLGAIVQLGDYIDALSSGMDDSVLVLHPAINELRVVRGKPVFSEAELFSAQMQSYGPLAPLPAARGETAEVQALGRKLQPLFQAALLPWLTGKGDARGGLARIGKVAEQLAAAATLPPVHQIWTALAAVTEAALASVIEETAELKRLFGAAGKQLRALADEGEKRAAESASDLAWQLLFHLGRSTAVGSLARAAREEFQLDAHLLPAAQTEELRRRIHGPTTALLNTVAAEIRNDLLQIKDSIDLAVRAGGKTGPELDATRTRMRRVADTLATLGLQMLSSAVANQIARLDETAHSVPTVDAWIEMATALLRVEHSLDGALFRQLRQSPLETAAGRPELEEQVPHSHDLLEGEQAFFRESLVSLARLKSLVDAYLKTNDAAHQAEASRRLGEVASGLSMLGHEAATTVARTLESYVRSSAFVQMRENAKQADLFADAVAGLEYAFEALRDGSAHSVAQFERLMQSMAPLMDTVAVHTESAPQPESRSEPVVLVEPSALPSSVEPDPVDPEIREVFLEEAGDVLAELQATLPRWAQRPEDRDQFTSIRRAFHTLKGSGRMVGATSIGEFGWAMESLANRCLDNTLSVNADIVTVMRDAVDLLPALIESFRDGRATPSQLVDIITRAENLAAGRGAANAAEPDLAQVFREDAQEKRTLIDEWLNQSREIESGVPVDADVLRAFHTLRGSAAVIGATALSELAGAFETYLDSTRSAGQRLPAAAMALLQESNVLLKHWIAAAGSPAMQDQDAGPWLTRIEQLQSTLPDAAVAASTERQLAEVFSDEAFDLLRKIEQAFAEWSRAEDKRIAPRDLKNDCHTLMGAALMSNCAAIAAMARALHERMNEALALSPEPDAEFFRALGGLLEEGYQLLDRYREGSDAGDGADLARRIQKLSWQSATAQILQEDERLIQPTSPEPVAIDLSGFDFSEQTAVPADDSAVNRDTSASEVRGEAYIADSDTDLRTLFLAEAHELIEALDGHCSAWELHPLAAEPVAQIAQVAHTLKGSALMAGVPLLATAADQLGERVLSARAANAVDHHFFTQLHHVSDQLHGALQALQGNEPADFSRLLAEIETLGQTAVAALDPTPDLSQVEEITLDSSSSPENAEDPVAGAVIESQLERPAEPALAPTIDADLVEIFNAEAAELLESLERALSEWQSSPHNLEALRDMQRSLHTLKGGARMAGLELMGNAAHDMETRVHQIEVAPHAADASAFARLVSDLESLQHMQDQLQRGDTASLAQAQIAVAPAAQPVAASEFVDDVPVAVETPVPVPAVVPSPPRSAVVPQGWDAALFWRPQEETQFSALRRETARVPVEALDGMLNQVGEISIYRSRLEQHNAGIQAQLNEMSQAITRLREQLRMMDIETEAQISARGMLTTGKEKDRYEGDFDPLEMDRYTRMQELSRALSESVGDLANLRSTLEDHASGAEALLQQQGRINTEVQSGLMGTLMVPFSRQVARLQRVVKQTAQETEKLADVQFSGVESELDRNVLERMTAPLEHLLRNAVVHGIEDPHTRRAAGKPESGTVHVRLWRDGTQLLIELRDDGKGLDLQAIRATAIKRGLMPAGAEVPDDAVAQFIFEPGFSTAKQLTQAAGRGIGMDVVAAEVKQLGGTLELGSESGKGARFLVRLPLTLAISQALLVGAGSEQFAIPLPSIEGIARIPRDQLDDFYREDGPPFEYGGHEYRVSFLGDFVGIERDPANTSQKTVNAILVRLGEGLGAQERHVAVVVDALYGNREIVSKAVGPQVSSINGVSGATILADGSVVLILDLPALAQDRSRRAYLSQAGDAARAAIAASELIMVVDDSITIRRVTERLLLKNGYRVVTAKDGLDAMAQLQTIQPAAVLLDIEMPRADGFEVATFIRNSANISRTPIVMITSRSGDKHRERARQIGVNRYMIKPFQEDQLVGELREVMQENAS